jgi:hypothetical protein
MFIMAVEVLYSLPLWLIFLLLIVSLMAADEVGYRFGRRKRDTASELSRSQFSHVQGALFGLFALLLGFTFAMALARFDQRTDMVVAESNAIGTAAGGVALLPEPQRTQMAALIHRYVDVRVEAGGGNLHTARWRALDQEAARLQDQLWQQAVAAADANPQSIPVGWMLQAVSAVGDAKEDRYAAQENHVPESVILLLFGFAILTSGTIGYGNALAGHRALGMAAVFTVLIVNVLMLIIDLDRPSRGLITIRQESMINLQKSLNAPR